MSPKASYRERKDRPGKWQVDVYIKRRGGQVQRQRFDVGSEAEAREAAEQLNKRFAEEKRAQETIFESVGGPIRATDAFTSWLAANRDRLSDNTIPVVESQIAHLSRFFGNQDLRNLTDDDVVELTLYGVRQGLGFHAVTNLISRLRAVLNWLRRRQVLSELPVIDMMATAKQVLRARGLQAKVGGQAWSREQALGILKIARETAPAWVYNTLFVLYHTGMRSGEALALNWEDVNLPKRTILVQASIAQATGRRRGTKAGKSRVVDLSGAMIEKLTDLNQQVRGRPSDPVLVAHPHRPGRRIRKSTLDNHWSKIKNAAVAQGVAHADRLHNFRRTWTSLALASGADPLWVARNIGDSLDVLYKNYATEIQHSKGDRDFSFLG